MNYKIMKIVERNIEEIKPYKKNAKKHSDKQVKQVAKSIKEFGFNQPIVVDKNDIIIVGHGRLLASEKLGLKKVPVLTIDLNEEQAKAYRLADNRLNESEWDMDLVIDELKDLDLKGFDIEITGFDDSLLEEQYNEKQAGAIYERFLMPPFSVFNAREGRWQDRKREWISLGIKSEVGRGDELLGEGLNKLAKKMGDNQLTGTSVFDPVLAEIHYLWFAPKGGKILDPFAGGSVRGIVANKLGYKYYGCDLSKDQIKENKKQGREILGKDNSPVWVNDDSMNIKKHFGDKKYDLLFTCPPYADLEVYSDDERDISNMDYDEFMKVYAEIIKRSVDLLDDNRFAIFTIGEVRDKKTGAYKNFVADTIKACADAGLHYYNESILVTSAGTLAMRITKQFKSGRKIGKTHQNILVFWKGDPKAVKETVKDWEIEILEEINEE